MDRPTVTVRGARPPAATPDDPPDLRAAMRGVGAEGPTPATTVLDRIDRMELPVEYDPRSGGETLKGLFEFRALSLAHLSMVTGARLRLIGTTPLECLTPNEAQMYRALSTLEVALVKFPTWYDPSGRSLDLGLDLYAGLYLEYLKWDEGLFRGLEASGDGAEARPAFRVVPLVGGGDE